MTKHVFLMRLGPPKSLGRRRAPTFLFAPLAVLLLPIFAGSASAQAAATFEVASIKPADDEFSTKPEVSPGRFRWTTQLAYLVGYAHNLEFSRVSGSSRLLGNTYQVEATFDPAANETQIRSMLLQLLQERFAMLSHRVPMEAEGYALVADPQSPKLRESDAQIGARFIAGHLVTSTVEEMEARGATMEQLAIALERSIRTPVWDRTNLSGRYDFVFRYARDLNGDPSGGAPWLGTALRETLGLSLEKQKGTVDRIVVDRLQPPTEN